MGNEKIIAIANRGEVAVRIIQAAKELGYRTALLYSEVDRYSRAYRMADKKICIGPAATSESYLNIERVLDGALAAGAWGLHPGFGFLSENAAFARACLQKGIEFIGPRPESIALLGDKVKCKELARNIGVPLVPGFEGSGQDVELLISEAKKIGFPVLVKAAAGGGGRGMKLIEHQDEAREKIESAMREAQLAFGSSHVFLEKYLARAKHIEMQMFGDASGHIYCLFDRECSVQRRHQKIIEEAPSPSLTAELRTEMADCAKRLLMEAKYQSAGTVEFLLEDGKFYLLEVNTRLQVEHPVTEMILQVDLVKAQIRTASGQSVFKRDFKAEDIRGASIECRLLAEDPFQGGMPSTGLITTFKIQEGLGRRFEYGFEAGDSVTPYYDSMIAKLIVWNEDRASAIKRMHEVLDSTIVFGVHTNIPLLREILKHSEFTSGQMTTQFFAKYFSESLVLSSLLGSEGEDLIAKIKKEILKTRSSKTLRQINSLQEGADPFVGYFRN